MAVVDLIARQMVLVALEAAERRFIAREAELIEAGRLAEAHGAHEYVRWCHRAWEAEMKDPQPKGPD